MNKKFIYQVGNNKGVKTDVRFGYIMQIPTTVLSALRRPVNNAHEDLHSRMCKLDK